MVVSTDISSQAYLESFAKLVNQQHKKTPVRPSVKKHESLLKNLC